MTSGVSGGILLALMATVNAGDEVLIADPYFVMYKHLVNLIGARPVFVDTYPDFHLRADRIEAAVTPRTRLIILNSPCNPTGAVLSKDDLEAIVAVARRHNLLVMSDECYNGFCYDGPFATPWPMYDRVILLRGFSKTYAMTGWRLGYAVGPASIIQAMTTLQQYTFVCGPAPLQAGAVAAFQTSPAARDRRFPRAAQPHLRGPARAVPRDPARGGVLHLSGGAGRVGLEVRRPGPSRRGCSIIPGGVFSERDTHFRISYAGQPPRRSSAASRSSTGWPPRRQGRRWLAAPGVFTGG